MTNPLKVVHPPAAPELSFTGERFVPGAGVEITYDHWARYQFAAQFVAGKRVLDIAGGEGYGADFLAGLASKVTAVDIDEQSVAHARRKYAGRSNLSFQRENLNTFLAQAPAGSFDVVTAFEILEHVDSEQQESMMRGISRVLAPGGVAVISTPDKFAYSDVRISKNEYHVCELYRPDFEALLQRSFKHFEVYEQAAFTGTAVFRRGATEAFVHEVEWTDLVKLKARLRSGVVANGQYMVAVVGNDPLPKTARSEIVLDPAKKLIAEEKANLQTSLDEARRAAFGGEGDSNSQAQLVDALSTTVDVLSRKVADTRLQHIELTRAQMEVQHLRDLLHKERLKYQHLERMLAVKTAMRVKNGLDKVPMMREVMRRVLMQVVR